MKLKGLAGALPIIVAGFLACWAARGDNSRSEFNWSMPALDKWLLGMYSDDLAAWDVEPEKHVSQEVPAPRLVPGLGLWSAFGNSALLPSAHCDLIFDPPLSEVYAAWRADLPVAPEPRKTWADSFELLALADPKLTK